MLRSAFAAVLFTIASSAQAQTVTPLQRAPASWQTAGSDIPPDPAWRTGTLANGLRWAVRRNALPPGAISVRVRVEVGGLMEADDEQGWSHLLEHMTFRGSAHYPDGEGLRVWERLGATFGADTNAGTTLTATTYQLDLPRADAASYTQAMAVLAEMVESARVDAAPLEVERRVVLAEKAARFPPLAAKIRDATNPVLLTGLKAERRDVIGTEATLQAATADRLRAYYKRWYRPTRTEVIVVGDADPALLERVVRERFGGWKSAGPEPAEPAYGALVEPSTPVALVIDPLAPRRVQLAWERPHDDGPWTIARQRGGFLNWVAAATLNPRLDAEAREGGPLLSASANFGGNRHLFDALSVGFGSRSGQFIPALNQLFGVLNAAARTPPSQAEIDQQVAIARGRLNQLVLGAQTVTSPALASSFARDISNADVSATPQFSRSLFEAESKTFTPDVVGRAIATLLAPTPRLVELSPTPVAGGAPALLRQLTTAQQMVGTTAAAVRAVSLDELTLPGSPATVVSRSSIADLGIERVRFSNGVELRYKRTAFERDRIRIRVVVGHGLLARDPGDPALFWSSAALGRSGLGPYTPEELARVTAGRLIGFSIGSTLSGVVLGSATDAADLPDALKLMMGGLTQLRFDAIPVTRLKDTFAATNQTIYSQPGSVLGAFGTPFFYGGDLRFRGVPPLAEVRALTPEAFRAFWQPQLAAGPIVVEAVGDLDGPALERAVADTFGRLAPRPDVAPTPRQLAVRATPPGAPVTLYHKGDSDQAMVVRIYPTLGDLQDLPEQRALGIAAAIIQTRLTDEFREQQGGTYAPFVSHRQNDGLPFYGAFVAGAQLRPARRADFYGALDRAIADLATHGPNEDELTRARTTQISAYTRSRSNNGYWLGLLEQHLDDPRALTAIRTAISGREAVDAAAVKAVVAKYLAGPGKGFEVEVVPEVRLGIPQAGGPGQSP